MNENNVCQIVFGSHLYGIATESSDNDVRGIFVPSAQEVFLGRIPRTNKDNGGTDDFELYSLQHFVKLALQGQTVAIDMLFAPLELVTLGERHGYIWKDLISLRQHFLSKRMNAFVGYARGQACKYSLKGERLAKLLRVEEEMLALFCEDPHCEIGFIWDKLEKDDERISARKDREFQICGNWYGEHTPVMYVMSSIQNLVKRYGERAKLARDSNCVDWKAMSHAVRVSLELKELLTTKNLIFPLKDKEMLLKIKLGQENFEKVEEILDQLLVEIEDLSVKSDLPDKPNSKLIEDWLVDVMCETCLQ